MEKKVTLRAKAVLKNGKILKSKARTTPYLKNKLYSSLSNGWGDGIYINIGGLIINSDELSAIYIK